MPKSVLFKHSSHQIRDFGLQCHGEQTISLVPSYEMRHVRACQRDGKSVLRDGFAVLDNDLDTSTC